MMISKPWNRKISICPPSLDSSDGSPLQQGYDAQLSKGLKQIEIQETDDIFSIGSLFRPKFFEAWALLDSSRWKYPKIILAKSTLTLPVDTAHHSKIEVANGLVGKNKYIPRGGHGKTRL